MSIHEALTRLISGFLVFPVFLLAVTGVSLTIEAAGDAAGVNVLSNVFVQVFAVGLAGAIAIAIVWRLLRWLEPGHWQGEGLGLWTIRFFADGAIATAAAFGLFYPVMTLYKLWDPAAFTGFLGGLDALYVIPIEAVLCLIAAVALIIARRSGAFGSA